MTIDKQNLRKYFRDLRSKISAEEKISNAALAAKNFYNKIVFLPSDIIALYYPIENELSTIPLAESLSSDGIRLCLPSITGKTAPLSFKSWNIGEELIDGRFFNIKEPLDTAPFVIPTIIVIPCLAFDNKGHRLGYGGGFYDRTIEHIKKINPTVQTIIYAHSCQECPDLPSTETDLTADIIITDKTSNYPSSLN